MPTGAAVFDGTWIDSYLLAGTDRDICLDFDEPVPRGALRAQVAARVVELRAAGLRPGGAICLRLPPSLAFVVNLLAAMRVGAQVSLLDHRLTDHEVGQALAHVGPQFVVSAPDYVRVPLRGYATVPAVTTAYPGRPAATGHALLQLSSGSTGQSKVIGRTAAELIAEVERYKQIEGTPLPGERIVLLASMVHVLGLVGGLLYSLHRGVRLVLPRFLSADAILSAVAAGAEPATVLGVPMHLEMLVAGGPVGRPAGLKRMTVGGELVRDCTWNAFTDRYAVPLGNMYGMTEVGVIATDLFGESRPALRPAPGIVVREEAGQLAIAAPANPYVGQTAPGRWVDGWLYTRDAGTVDPANGLVTVCGRLDSQVSVGGLKVDLTEVEQTIAGLPGVVETVVVYDGAIEAFVVLAPAAALAGLKEAMSTRLAPFKRPRTVHVVTRLPRTASGKLVRNVEVLATAERVAS
jgi:acyl-coenzyme A synthetase/AMP-(fatty) acid ligase